MKSLGARIGGCCLLAAAVLLLPAAPLAAEGTAPTGNFSTTIASAHIWRGYELSRNSIVIQPSATVGYRGFSANFW
ncbi:MAG: hypothetical protein FWE89_04215, partial [Syntrophaceae bacterium]|nr:hypothetical protein [Syntrophaceae bacterium]